MTKKKPVSRPKKASSSKSTSASVASKAARILATSTDANVREVAASALSQVEHDPVVPVTDETGAAFASMVDKSAHEHLTPFSLDDFAVDVLANVGMHSSVSYECYTTENVAAALQWLNYNGGYICGSDGTRVEVRKRAQQ